jgi:hypothetical protein
MLEGASLLTLLATSKVDVPVNLGAAHAQYPTKPSGPTYPSRPKSKLCKNPAPAGTRHPTPGTLLKKFPGFCPPPKSLYFSVLLVLSSCSFKEPGQQDDQDGENKLSNLGKTKLCKNPALPALRHCLKKCPKLSWRI